MFNFQRVHIPQNLLKIILGPDADKDESSQGTNEAVFETTTEMTAQ